MSDTGMQVACKNDWHQQTIFSKKRSRMLVAAIDIGTTFSGCAFCLKSEFEKDKKISMVCVWAAGSQSVISIKAPTSVLFNPDGEFDSFGLEAEDCYADLATDDEHGDWYFFRRFKMGLHDIKV